MQTSWPRAPSHQLSEGGTYFVTVGTYQRLHHFRERRRIEVLHRGLLKVAHDFRWRLEAWAVFSNHYHFVGHAPESETAESLPDMLSILHAKTASWINRLDRKPGQKVWHNYRDTRLTYRNSYLARLHYVHHNAVKHGLVAMANQYPWCSAGWFEQTSPRSVVEWIYRVKIDALKLPDDFNPCPPE